MEIRILGPDIYGEYGDFLLQNKESSFYYSLKYKGFLKDLLGCGEEYLVALEGNKMVGILPLMYFDGRYGRVYNSLPYYGSNGGVIALNKEVSRALVKKYNEIINKDGVASATIVANPLINRDYSELDYNLTDIRIGQFTNLQFRNDPEEELLMAIDSSARRNVRKAEKSGVTVEIDNNQMDFLMETHKENVAAIGGKAKKDAFFESVRRHFAPGEEYNIYVARQGARPISALLIFYFNKTAEYFMPVTRGEERNVQPMALILHRAMPDAFRRGFTSWNWGGTWLSQEGVLRFKKKWGAEEKRYLYYIKINNQKLYGLPKEEILKEYPDFFVIPFDKLSQKP